MSSYLLNMAYEMQKMKMDLESFRRIHDQQGAPAYQYSTVHVGGTNGKGSVCLKIAQGLQEKGLKVGLYTSPHITHLNERVKINGKPVENLDDYIEPLLALKMTYFETLTLAGFQAFADQKVDIAVIEVGLGGRLDATNIITPKVSVITSIGWDHMAILGPTLEAIAHEKAGIIKPNVPVVIGPHAKPYEVFKAKTDLLTIVQGEFAHFDEENQAIAKAALELMGIEPSDSALKKVPDCRFMVKGDVIFDVAHNLSAFQALFDRLDQINRPKRLVVAFSADKAIHEMIDFLNTKTSSLHFTQAEHPRAYNFSQKNIYDTLKEAYALAQKNGELLVICGTFFMMASALEAMRAIQGEKDDAANPSLQEGFLASLK
jgi:dihydrofolate synthase/folylpolyglutamate synthase